MEQSRAHKRANGLVAAHDQARILGLIDRDNQMSNLVIVQRATLPLQAQGPRRGTLVALGLAAGLAAGLAFAVLRQILDTRLRYPDNLEQLLGVQILGVVPEEPTWRKLGDRIRRHRPSGA